MSQPPPPGPPFGEQPSSGQPYPGQPPYQGQPAQPYPDQGQPYPTQPYPTQPYPAQPSYPDPAQPSYPGQQAYSGQPYPGQPNPDVPSSVPPGYPPTQGYDQYAQPGYPGAGYPSPVPPKKSRTLPIVLTVVAIVLVLCVGGGTAVALVLRNQSDKHTATGGTSPATDSPTTEPSATDAPTDEPSTGAAPATTVKVVEPKTLDGLPKLNYKQFQNTVDLLKTIMSSYPGASGSVGAVYGRVGTKNAVLMTAAKADISDPEYAVDSVLAGGGSSTKVSGITSVSTGSLGGTAKCGNATSSGQKIAVCAWADDGSLGMVFFYFKTTSAIKDKFPKVRAEIEKKS